MAEYITIPQDPLPEPSEPPDGSGERPAGISTAQYQAPYTQYSIQTDYLFDSGLVQAAVAAATGAARNVKLNAPVMRKVVSWTARRVGAQPVLPLPEPASGNEALATARITPQAPTLDMDGMTRVYTVSGVYTFLLSVPIWYTEGLPMGALPPTTDVAASNVLGPAQFQSGILS